MKNLDAFLREHIDYEFVCEQKGKMLFITLIDFKDDLVDIALMLRWVFEEAGLTEYELILIAGCQVVYTDFGYRLHRDLCQKFGGSWVGWIWHYSSPNIQTIKYYMENSRQS